jgi:hypothetical protein
MKNPNPMGKMRIWRTSAGEANQTIVQVEVHSGEIAQWGGMPKTVRKVLGPPGVVKKVSFMATRHNRKESALSHLSYACGECHFRILIRSLLEEIT